MSATTPGAADAASPERVAGPIRRLNAQNGLFLRAEHLEGIQDYARSLSTALGIAVGPGVVYGYELSLQDSVLHATAGLALTATGAPLQTDGPLEIRLDAAHLPELAQQNGYWLVELAPATELTGNENAYGTVCADPCDGATTIRPWVQSLVELRLTATTITDLDLGPPGQRRSRLASLYFEQERRDARPWVVPRDPDVGVRPVLGNPWHEGGAEPGPTVAAVPIGVILLVDKKPVLDTWTARREILGPPGAARWAGHLAMRPWPVFLAQLLQFEDQLSPGGVSSAITVGGGTAAPAVVDPKDEILRRYIADHPGRGVRKLAAELQAVEVGATLPGLGFVELPPAGYLAPIADGDAGTARLNRLFDKTATLRFRDVGADEVAGDVQAAQHRDRIPLDGRDPLPEIDILRPTQPVLKNGSYGWVAFVRRDPCCDEYVEVPRTDDVEIAYTGRAQEEVMALLTGGTWPESTSMTVVHYPPDEIALPPDAERPAAFDGLEPFAAVAIAPSSAAAKLEKKRAKVIVDTWSLTISKITHTYHEAFFRSVILMFVKPKQD